MCAVIVGFSFRSEDFLRGKRQIYKKESCFTTFELRLFSETQSIAQHCDHLEGTGTLKAWNLSCHQVWCYLPSTSGASIEWWGEGLSSFIWLVGSYQHFHFSLNSHGFFNTSNKRKKFLFCATYEVYFLYFLNRLLKVSHPSTFGSKIKIFNLHLVVKWGSGCGKGLLYLILFFWS